MTDLFKETIPSLLQNNNYCFEKETYNSYVVNKALSNHIDTIFYADEMNSRSNIDDKLQYDFYFYSVKKYKRPFVKWSKNKKDIYLDRIKEYYSCSDQVAKSYLEILTNEQICSIIERLDKGGVSK